MLTCWMISSGPCPLLLMSRSTRFTRSKCTPPEQQQQQQLDQQWSPNHVICLCHMHRPWHHSSSRPLQLQGCCAVVILLAGPTNGQLSVLAGCSSSCLSNLLGLSLSIPSTKLLFRCAGFASHTCHASLSAHSWVTHSLTRDAHSEVQQWLEPLTECVDALNDDHTALRHIQ